MSCLKSLQKERVVAESKGEERLRRRRNGKE
jgi:hypothetical protein